ncbi:MAG: hypothetical protein LBE82_10720, partial [Chitinophagaceae bacterium]|nr:hypothetical protein [Chitinophagaceae bacterium]
MKHQSFIIASIIGILAISCGKKKNDDVVCCTEYLLGNWVSIPALPGAGRYYASSFVIGDSAFVIGGFFSTSGQATVLNDVWSFNPSGNKGTGSWTQMAPIPVGRGSAVAFSIGNKGYVGTGSTAPLIAASGTSLNDMWEYDPATNKWIKKAAVPGGARFAAIGFGIGNLGYVGTGAIVDNAISPGTYAPAKDFYSFDPTQGDSGVWVQESSMINDKRYAAQSFVYNNQGYVVGGMNDGGKASVDFEVFTPGAAQGAGSWKVLTPITPQADSAKTSGYTPDL